MYTKEFKESVVQRALRPGAPSVDYISQELGLGHSTLSRWIDQFANMSGMSKRKIKKQRPNDRSPAEKLRLVSEAGVLSDDELGEYLRKNGIHAAQLDQWRKDAMTGLSAPLRKPSGRLPGESKKIRELERELRRKNKALAETAALLVLKKKVQEIWGDEDDDTMYRSDK